MGQLKSTEPRDALRTESEAANPLATEPGPLDARQRVDARSPFRRRVVIDMTAPAGRERPRR
ncbi:MAG: hypothetical protein NVS3B10_00610 [Polyangiales bacterium]